MAYDINGLAAYSKSNGQILIEDLLVMGQSFGQAGIGKQSGIKSSDKLVDFSIDSQTYLQATGNDPSTLTYTGGSTLLDVDISVVELGIMEKYSTNRLNGTISQMQMRAGSSPDNPLVYERTLVDLKANAVGNMNDTILWQGDTGTGNTNGNTNKFDGWKTLIAAGSPVSGGSAAAFNSSTVIATVNAFHNVATTAFPTWVNEGSFLYMSPSQFDIYYRAQFALNGVIDANTLGSGVEAVQQFNIPGTRTLVTATQGLTGVNNIYETRSGNLVIGCDLESETEELTLEYLNESRLWRIMGIWKLGAQVARVSEVVATL